MCTRSDQAKIETSGESYDEKPASGQNTFYHTLFIKKKSFLTLEIQNKRFALRTKRFVLVNEKQTRTATILTVCS